jgi:hypothetical protein
MQFEAGGRVLHRVPVRLLRSYWLAIYEERCGARG